LNQYSNFKSLEYTPVSFYIVSYYYNSVNDKRINTGQNIIKKDIEDYNLCIIYNKSIYTELIDENHRVIRLTKTYRINDQINLFGNNYRITGIMNNFGYSIVPYTSGLKYLDIHQIDVILKEGISYEQKKRIAEYIKNEFPGLAVVTPPRISQELYGKVTYGLFILFIACVIGFFYLLYIYKYIIEKNIGILLIYRILGLSRKNTLNLIIFQITFINTSIYLIALLLYRFIIINIFDLYVPNLMFILILYTFIISISSLLIYPFANKVLRQLSFSGVVE